jgi:hypothetical protein
LTILLSTATFAAICSVLLVYNGKTTPQLPLGVTLNAIIFALAILAKSSALLILAAAMSRFRWLWLREMKHACNLPDLQLVR